MSSPSWRTRETTWPYTAIGIGFALLGILCIGYGEQRRRAVDQAVRRGEFAEISGTVSLVVTGAGVLLGVAIVVLVLVKP